MSLGGVFKLQLGRRLARLVLPSILVTEYGKVDVTPFNLAQVDIIRFSVSGRNIFEQEHIRYEPAKQRVVVDKILYGTPFHCQFLLHAADENAISVGIRFLHFCSLVVSEMPLQRSSVI